MFFFFEDFLSHMFPCPTFIQLGRRANHVSQILTSSPLFFAIGQFFRKNKGMSDALKPIFL